MSQPQPQFSEAPAGPAAVRLDSADDRQRLTPAALKAFFRIVEAWGLTGDQARLLLGGVSNGRYAELRRKVDTGAGDFRALSMDELQRISFLIGITKALRILHSPQLADRWMTMPNTNPLFGGLAPIDYALRGGIPALETIRRLVDGRRGMLA